MCVKGNHLGGSGFARIIFLIKKKVIFGSWGAITIWSWDNATGLLSSMESSSIAAFVVCKYPSLWQNSKQLIMLKDASFLVFLL